MVETTAENAIPLANMARQTGKDSKPVIRIDFMERGGPPLIIKCVIFFVLLLALAQVRFIGNFTTCTIK